MKSLYTRFRDFMSPDERRLLGRVIRDSRPRADWEEWMEDPE
jgi:hypothetical protein